MCRLRLSSERFIVRNNRSLSLTDQCWTLARLERWWFFWWPAPSVFPQLLSFPRFSTVFPSPSCWPSLFEVIVKVNNCCSLVWLTISSQWFLFYGNAFILNKLKRKKYIQMVREWDRESERGGRECKSMQNTFIFKRWPKQKIDQRERTTLSSWSRVMIITSNNNIVTSCFSVSFRRKCFHLK